MYSIFKGKDKDDKNFNPTFLLTYDGSNQKAQIYLEASIDQSNQIFIYKYYLDTNHQLVKERIDNDSLKNIEDRFLHKVKDIDVAVNRKSKQYTADPITAKSFISLTEKYLGKQPHDDLYREDTNWGIIGKVNELKWARMQLAVVSIKVKEEDLLPLNKSHCLLM